MTMESIKITDEAMKILRIKIATEAAKTGTSTRGQISKLASEAIIEKYKSSTGSSSQPTSNPIPAPGSQSQKHKGVIYMDKNYWLREWKKKKCDECEASCVNTHSVIIHNGLMCDHTCPYF